MVAIPGMNPRASALLGYPAQSSQEWQPTAPIQQQPQPMAQQQPQQQPFASQSLTPQPQPLASQSWTPQASNQGNGSHIYNQLAGLSATYNQGTVGDDNAWGWPQNTYNGYRNRQP